MNQKLIKLTKDLIKFPSTKENPQAQKKVIDFVADYFKKDHVFTEKYCHNGIWSLVINLKKEKNPFLLFNGHLDVVTADKKDFIPYLKDKKLYGRGAGDMKGQIAVIMEVVKFFSKQKDRPSLGLMFTCDEETGGANGVGFLLEQKGYNPKLAIVPDAGNSLENIIIKEKGVWHLKISARGKSAHAARPYLGENAIDKLIDNYLKIRNIIPKAKKKAWKNSLNLGIISGGIAVNKIPDYAEMKVDIRVTSLEEGKRIYRKIQKIVGEKNVEVIIKADPLTQKKNNGFIRAYQKIAEEKIHKKIKFGFEEGAADARYFNEKDIPVILTEARADNFHSQNEWIDLEEQEKFQQILIEFIIANFNNKRLG